MIFSEIKSLLDEKFPGLLSGEDTGQLQPELNVAPEHIQLVCRELQENPNTYFDFLSSLTAADCGPERKTMEVIYHLYSIPFGHFLVLKTTLSYNDLETFSVTNIWKGANWQEREVFDMFGIRFEGHPDLRRILLPADWEGFPLRKDYQVQEHYHGIKVVSETQESELNSQ